MSAFFCPSSLDGARGGEDAYRQLRDQAETHTGAVARERRIEGVLCRRSGKDCELRVGEPDAGTGQTVAAIIQVGRDDYTVHHLGTDAARSPAPLVLRRCDVYAVTEFQ